MYYVCYDDERNELVKEYIAKNKKSPNLVIRLISSHLNYSGFRKYSCAFRNCLIRYRCKYWITDTISIGFSDKTPFQKVFCLNYSTPFKLPYSKLDRSYIDYSIETSIMSALTHSALYNIQYGNNYLLGFPRNDNLFSSPKEGSVRTWLKKNTRFEFRYVAVYAPTYRNYPGAYDDSIFGFKASSSEIESFLEENKILIVVKYHPLQDLKGHTFPPHILEYKKSYDFSLYDLLAVADVLISDYSSVIHDFILTGKPVVLNTFDKAKYDDTRGFCFDPVDAYLPCPTISTFEEFKKELLSAVSSFSPSDQYSTVCQMFQKYRDPHSTERVAASMQSLLIDPKYQLPNRVFLSPDAWH